MGDPFSAFQEFAQEAYGVSSDDLNAKCPELASHDLGLPFRFQVHSRTDSGRCELPLEAGNSQILFCMSLLFLTNNFVRER
jgi:hypothetical protein